LAVVGVPSREARPSGLDEDTLSPELRTAGLLRPHVWVGYQWSHTGFCPGDQTSHNRYIRSFVSQPSPNRTCSFHRIRLSSAWIVSGSGAYEHRTHPPSLPFQSTCRPSPCSGLSPPLTTTEAPLP